MHSPSPLVPLPKPTVPLPLLKQFFSKLWTHPTPLGGRPKKPFVVFTQFYLLLNIETKNDILYFIVQSHTIFLNIKRFWPQAQRIWREFGICTAQSSIYITPKLGKLYHLYIFIYRLVCDHTGLIEKIGTPTARSYVVARKVYSAQTFRARTNQKIHLFIYHIECTISSITLIL